MSNRVEPLRVRVENRVNRRFAYQRIVQNNDMHGFVLLPSVHDEAGNFM